MTSLHRCLPWEPLFPPFSGRSTSRDNPNWVPEMVFGLQYPPAGLVLLDGDATGYRIWWASVPRPGRCEGERESPEDLRTLPGEIIGHAAGYIMDNIWVYGALFERAPHRYSAERTLVHLWRKAMHWAQLSLSVGGTGLWPYASEVLYIDPQSAGSMVSSILWQSSFLPEFFIFFSKPDLSI